MFIINKRLNDNQLIEQASKLPVAERYSLYGRAIEQLENEPKLSLIHSIFLSALEHLSSFFQFLGLPQFPRQRPVSQEELKQRIRLIEPAENSPEFIDTLAHNSELTRLAVKVKTFYLTTPLDMDSPRTRLLPACNREDISEVNNLLQDPIMQLQLLTLRRSPLDFAVWIESIPVLEEILTHHIALAQPERIEKELLPLVAKRGSIELVKRVLRIPEIRQHVAGNNNAALCKAIEHGNVEVANRLLMYDATLTQLERDPKPLMVAVRHNQVDIVRQLLKNEILRSKAAQDQNQLLRIAIDLGHIEIVEALLKCDEVSFMVDIEYNHLFRLAAYKGHLKIVQLLLKEESVREQVDALCNQALQWAMDNDHISVVRELLKYKKVRSWPHLLRVLDWGIRHHDAEIVRQVLREKIDSITNPRDLLRSAVRCSDNLQVVQEMLRYPIMRDVADHPTVFALAKPNIKTLLWAIRGERSFFNITDNWHQVQAGLIFEAERKFRQAFEQERVPVPASSYAASDALIQRAKEQYSAIEPSVHHQFEQRGLTQIETQIREMILNQITEKDQREEVQAFIQEHRNSLILAQDEALMTQARALFNHNDTRAHVAWRAFDENAPVHRPENPEAHYWPNLLTPPAPEHEKDDSYNVQELGTENTVKGTSDRLREIVAHLFLWIEKLPEEQKRDAQHAFINNLAELRRAHNDRPTDNRADEPSCFPGSFTRMVFVTLIGKTVDPKKLDIISNEWKKLVIQQFQNVQCTQEERLILFESLIYLNFEQAYDVFCGKTLPLLSSDEEEYTKEMMDARLKFQKTLSDQLDTFILSLERKENFVIMPNERLYLEFLLQSLTDSKLNTRLSEIFQKLYTS